MANAVQRLCFLYADKKDAEQALAHLDREAYHAIKFVKFEKYGEDEYVNTSLAMRGCKSGGFTTNDSTNSAMSVLDFMAQTRWDFVRDTAEFQAITAKLTEYAGNWGKRE